MHLFDLTHLLNLIFHLTAMRSTGTYPSLKYEMSSVGCGRCLERMLCQVLGQHWSAMWACRTSLGSRACWQRHKISWLLPPPPHLQMRHHAPDNHILDLVVICTLSPLWILLLHVALSSLAVYSHIFRFVPLIPGWAHPRCRLLKGSFLASAVNPLLPMSCHGLIMWAWTQTNGTENMTMNERGSKTGAGSMCQMQEILEGSMNMSEQFEGE